jgi:hypothetical protein
MVIVQLLGGLGNQMFQYALGRVLSIKNNDQLKLDTSILLDHRPGIHAVNRNFDLKIFDINPEQANIKDTWKYHSHGSGIAIKLLSFGYRKLMGNNIITESNFDFDPPILNLKGNIYLAGNWQSYKYFEEYEENIREDFKFRSRLQGPSALLAEEILNTESVCINVRRTDYVTVKSTAETLSLTGIEYYKRAVDYINNIQPNCTYFIFSDDIEWCKENFSFIENKKKFVDHSYAGFKFSDYLQLMKLCKSFIIPNSTFAWWAAWLNENKNKTVIVPKKWMNDPAINTQDLIPPDWIQI